MRKKQERRKREQDKEAKELGDLIRSSVRMGHRACLGMECLQRGRGFYRVWDIAHRLNKDSDVIVNLHFTRQ